MLNPELREQTSTGVVEHLSVVTRTYLQSRPHLSVNGLSKKCGVSEPTLRRIISLQVKTLPQLTTVLDILTYLSGTNSVREIVAKYPGPIADHIQTSMPHLAEFDREYSNRINEEIENPIKYIIYKLSLNSSGVTQEKIKEIYGNHGLSLLFEMVQSGFIKKNDQGNYKAVAGSFSGSHDQFVSNFKTVADFIKPGKYRNRKPLNPFFANCSESVNGAAYEKIFRIQRKAMKRIREVLNSEDSRGSIPAFILCAFDTLDLNSAYELEDKG